MLFDEGPLHRAWDAKLASTGSPEIQRHKLYRDRLKLAEKTTGMKDAQLTGEGLI